MTEKEKRAARLATAERLILLDPFSAADYDETAGGIAEIIESDPVAIINNLIDIIEDLQS